MYDDIAIAIAMHVCCALCYAMLTANISMTSTLFFFLLLLFIVLLLVGLVSTFAGRLDPGFRDGFGTNAQFEYPQAITIDNFGTLYVADVGNFCVRQIKSTGSRNS